MAKSPAIAAAAAPSPSPSGPHWCDAFPTSRSLDDLAAPFRDGAKRFVAALQAAGGSVSIAATRRPAERAWLMHHCWRIAEEGLDPRQVGPKAGIPIQWVHVDAKGKFDRAASVAAAKAMVARYRIAFRPALTSKHIAGLAIDMSITWSGRLDIAGADGNVVGITGTPRTGANRSLHAVGEGYGVVKLVSDPPHWSDDGH